MHTVGILLIGMAMGIAFIYLANYVVGKINVRLNNGQIVRFDGERIGHIVSCRYGGMKKYFYTNKIGSINTTKSYFDRSSAFKACQEAHLDNVIKYQNSRPATPKQSSFPRA
jgi:hypothetical protein